MSPLDGSQDAEVSQRAISQALSDFFKNHPDVDLEKMSTSHIDWVAERHLVYELHSRVYLDIGNAVYKNAPSTATAVIRQNEIRDYIKQAVAAEFRKHTPGNKTLTAAHVQSIAHAVIKDTLSIFEEYFE